MAIKFKSWHKVSLNGDPDRPIPLACVLFQGDEDANQIGLIPFENGEETVCEGTITGTAIISDGTEVTITGGIEEGRPFVTLTAACYEKPGGMLIEIYKDGAKMATLAGQVFPVTTGVELSE